MNLSLRENSSHLKHPLMRPPYQDDEPDDLKQQQQSVQSDKDDSFNVTITERPQNQQKRIIRKSVVNRSCINTVSFCGKELQKIPMQLSSENMDGLKQVQKIDLSFNTIADVHGLSISQLPYLKQLLLNDNNISQLPFRELNQCKSLKFLKISNNKLYIMPPLTQICYIQAKNNPLRLITSQLVQLSQIQYMTFDWLDYLVDGVRPSEDRTKDYISMYGVFKKKILEKIDYDNEENFNYCDFHSYFSVRMDNLGPHFKQQSLVSHLIVKSMTRDDLFFIQYLKHYQNELNYANMTHNSKLLLQTVLDIDCQPVLQLFQLAKNNYAHEVGPDVYFQSVKLCCKYSNIQMFQFLIKIREQRKKIMRKEQIAMLIQVGLQNFMKDKDSAKILHTLMYFYKEVSQQKFVIKMPENNNGQSLKSLSLALLEIYQNQDLRPFFQLDKSNEKKSPLHFAMKSRNEELLVFLLKEHWDLFGRSKQGALCKFVPGCTQVSRKMIWKKEKILIKKQWAQSKETQRTGYPSNQYSRQNVEPFDIQSKVNIETTSLDQSFESIGKSLRQPLSSSRKHGLGRPLGDFRVKSTIEEKILPALFLRAKEYGNTTWLGDHSKKLQTLYSFLSFLSKLTKCRQESMMKRLELWKKIIEKLSMLYESVGQEDPLLQYEILQTAELMDGVRSDKMMPSIKVQGGKNVVSNAGFWCCQSITEEN